MYSLKDNGVVTEIQCGNNFEYILDNETNFANTDYKVLQSQNNGIFVRCMKMTRNGKPALYYMTERYKSMASMLIGTNVDTLITVIVNLFASILEVKNNGFLTCQSIDLSWDKIFIESNTLKVKLVYLPLKVKEFDNYPEFESELRSNIVRLINKLTVEPNNRINQFLMDLSNGSLSLEDIYNRSRGVGTCNGFPNNMMGNVTNQITPTLSNCASSQISTNYSSVTIQNSISQTVEKSGNLGNNRQNVMKLVAMNAPGYFEVILDGDNMLLGKKQELVDKAITFNNMISRKHCRITRVNGTYYICDEGSANGTFVNGTRIFAGQQSQINKGDIVRLANSDFQVR